MDFAIGRMLASLDALDLRRESLVVLTSDNGPEHRELNSWGSSGGLRGAKGYVYEGGIRVPLAVQWPGGLRGGGVVSEPVHLWDLLPTIAELARAPLPQARRIDGVSWLPLLQPHRKSRPGETGRSETGGSETGGSETGGSEAFGAGWEGCGGVRFVEGEVGEEPTSEGCQGRLKRRTPLFWAMHRGRGGMQYAMRVGNWKLLAGEHLALPPFPSLSALLSPFPSYLPPLLSGLSC